MTFSSFQWPSQFKLSSTFFPFIFHHHFQCVYVRYLAGWLSCLHFCCRWSKMMRPPPPLFNKSVCFGGDAVFLCNALFVKIAPFLPPQDRFINALVRQIRLLPEIDAAALSRFLRQLSFFYLSFSFRPLRQASRQFTVNSFFFFFFFLKQALFCFLLSFVPLFFTTININWVAQWRIAFFHLPPPFFSFFDDIQRVIIQSIHLHCVCFACFFISETCISFVG